MILYEKDRITLKGDTLRAIGNMLVAQREHGVGALMDRVMEEIPSAMHHETDARETWPRRWKRLRSLAASGPDTGKGCEGCVHINDADLYPCDCCRRGPEVYQNVDHYRTGKTDERVAPTTEREE
jgi:hypothetical protein